MPTDISLDQPSAPHSFSAGCAEEVTSTTIPRLAAEALQNAPVAKQATESIDLPRLTLQEIQKHTLLHEKEGSWMPRLKEALDRLSEEETIKIASNFLGGGLVTGPKGVDGMDAYSNFSTWSWFLGDIQKANPDPEAIPLLNEIQKGLKQLFAYSQTLHSLANTPPEQRTAKLHQESLKIAQTIHDLKSGEFHTLHGGWTNRGGGMSHALIYEFNRQKEGFFTLSIYTSTGFQLTSTLLKGDKCRIKPIVRFQDVPEHQLLFNGDGTVRPAFIQALVELKVLSAWDNNFTVEEEDVLEIFDSINKYRVPVSLEEQGAITGQRAGTCLPSSTKAWIRAHSREQNLYREIMFQLKLRLLIATYAKLDKLIEQDSPLGAQSRVLLKQIAKKLLRRIAKCVDDTSLRGALIDERRAKEATATAYDVLQKVEAADQTIDRARKKAVSDAEVAKADVKTQRKQRAASNWDAATNSKPTSGTSTPLPNLQLKIAANGRNLLEVLAKTCAFQKGRNSIPPELANLQLQHTLDQLPLPKISKDLVPGEQWIDGLETGFWKDIKDKYTLEACIDYLHQMASNYRASCHQDSASRKFTTIFSLQCLLHFLSLKADALTPNISPHGRLQAYKIPFAGSLANELEGLIYFDSHEYHRFQQVFTYFETFNLQASGPLIFENEHHTFIIKEKVKRAKGNGIFWKGILQGNPKLRKQLEKRAASKWSDYTEIPLVQKLTTLVEGSRADQETLDLLDKHGYGYLWPLRETTYWCHEWMHSEALAKDLVVKINRYDSGKSGVFKKAKFCNTQSDEVKKLGLQAHRPLTQEPYATFFNDPSTGRHTSDWQRGKAEVTSLQAEIKDPILKRLHRSLSEWKLTPNQLVMEMSQEIEAFQALDLHTLFYRLFFRSPVSKKKVAGLGAGQLLVDDQDFSLYNNCKAFIAKGISHFEKLDNPLNGVRFFLEFAVYLSGYLHDAGKFELAKNLCSVAVFDRLLKLETIDNQQRGILHLYRLLFYSNYPAGELSVEQLAAIYESWICHQLYPEPRDSQSPMAYKMAETFIQQLTANLKARLQKHPALQATLCTNILQASGVEGGSKSMQWEGGTYPLVTCEAYQIDLLHGKVYTPQGELTGMPLNYPWEKQNNFKALFGEQLKLRYFALGGGNIGFTHPLFGPFRLMRQENNSDYAIQRPFAGTKTWYAYNSIREVEGFPIILHGDHIFWTPVDKAACAYKGYFASLATQQRKYALQNDGTIIEVDSVSGKHGEQSRFVDGDSTAGLLQFDGHILRFTDQAGNLQRVQFPRYTSMEGNPLAFSREGNDFVWNENRQYYLPATMPQGYLGTLPNYLYLQARREGQSDKMLVPLQPIAAEKVSYANGKIDIENEKIVVPTKKSKEREIWDTCQYLTYDVQAGQLKPTTQEAQFYLAYVHFSQKNYADAIYWIKALNPLENLSPTSQKILELIIDLPIGKDYPQKKAEHHPEAKMVGLQAMLTKMKAKDKLAKEPLNKYFGTSEADKKRLKKIAIDILDVLQSLNNVGLACRFTAAEEEFFLHKIQLEFCDPGFILPQIDARLSFLKAQKVANEGDKNGSRVLPKSTAGRNWQPWMQDIEKLQWSKGVGWLSEGEIPSTCTRVDKKICAKGNGHLFLEANRIAKGESQAARDEMIFKLRLWRLHTDDLIVYYYGLIDCMLVMLKHPDNFPQPIDAARCTEAQKLEFLQKCATAYNDFVKTTQELFDSPLPIVDSAAPAGDRENFPITLNSAFEAKEKEAKDIAIQKQPMAIDLSTDETRWKQLQNWKAYFELSAAPAIDQAADFCFRCDEQLLSNTEKEYVDSLKRDLALLEKDYAQGKLINEKSQNVSLTKENCRQLQAKVRQKIATLTKKLDTTLQELLSKANRQPPEISKQLLHLAQKGGGVQKKVSFDDCIACLLSLDVREYALKNPQIGYKKSAEELAQLTLAVLDCKSHLAQLKGIEQLTTKISAIADMTDSTRASLCKNLYQELQAKYHYEAFSPEVQVALRTFSGETGMLPHKKQTALIEKMLKASKEDPERFKDIVIQLIMGGGKTSVLATILLHLAARRSGRLALFIVPSALFETVKTNLGQSLNKAFHTTLQAVEMSREEMTEYRLERLLETFAAAMHKNLPIIVKSTTLQCLELELLSRARSFTKVYAETEALKQTLAAKKVELDKISDPQEIRAEATLAAKTDKNEALETERQNILVRADTLTNRIEQIKHILPQTEISALWAEIGALNKKSFSLQIQIAVIAELAKYSKHKTAESPSLSWEVAAEIDLRNSLKAQIAILATRVADSEKQLKATQSRLCLLQKVVATLPECADALVDEVDLVLDALQEVNFPEGKPVPIKIERNNLLLQIYRALVSHTLKVHSLDGAPSIDKIVGLRRNEQSKMDKHNFLTHVVPVIAEHLADHFVPIEQQIPDFKESYIRYASGKIPLLLEELLDAGIPLSKAALESKDPDWRKFGTFSELESDSNFLKFMSHLYQKGDKEQRESANLMALSRHFLIELLPATLERSGHRNYGIKPGSAGQIIPYLGVATPATTKFGYHWEEACYYYQWAAGFAPSTAQILQMAKSYEAMARYYIKKNGETYEETVEYQEFLKLFNVRLDHIHNAGMAECAANFIQQNTAKSLDLQFENVAKHVSFNSERLTSNGTALMHQLASRRTMSGTPWNVEGYGESLKKRYKADSGTEGKILHALAQKQADGHIFEGDLSSVEAFLTGIFKEHPTPQKIRGIIEAGGLFKVFKNNLEAAKEIMAFLEKRPDLSDRAIEAVLFFHKDPEQDQPDTLYAWKRGATEPERIGGTSMAILEAKGLDAKKYFTFYDERHTTGTDIPQLPEAINLFTFDEKMLQRTVGQGIMRLRQFLSSQNVAMVVAKQSREALFNSGETLNDLLFHAAKTQSVRKTHDMVRYYQQQIDGLFRTLAVRKIVAALKDLADPQTAAVVIEGCEPFFVTSMVDEPFQQFGRLKRRVDTKQYLQRYLERKLHKFCAAMQKLGDQASLELAQRDAAAMQKQIAEAEGLPKKWAEPPENLGVEQEVEVQQQVHVDQKIQVEVALEKELEIELQRYEAEPASNVREETKLTMAEFLAKLVSLKADHPTEISLQEQLQAYRYGFDNKLVPYQEVFSEPIYGTVSFFNSCATTLPIFHKLQRPAKQILAVKHNHKMHWLLLSEREAKSAKKHLYSLYKQRDIQAEEVWLIQPDGTSLVENPHMPGFPAEEDAVKMGLLEINALLGNADYIDQHAGEAEDWLTGNRALKTRFLKLQCARDSRQHKVLRNSRIIAAQSEEDRFDPNQQTLKARSEKEKQHLGQLRPNTLLEAKLLNPKRVKQLHVDFIPYLGVDPEAKDALTLQALAALEGDILAAEKLTRQQFSLLRPYQIAVLAPQQVKWLSPAQIQYLTTQEQCSKLSEEQAAKITRKQQALIPHLSPEFYKTFTHPWQVNGVEPEQIDKLNKECWIYFSKAQMKSLSGAKIAQLEKIQLPPEKYGWIHGNQLVEIPTRFLNRILKEQIREITNAELIPQLETLAKKGEEFDDYSEGSWTRWIAPKMVKHIDCDKQLKYLNEKNLIRKVPLAWVCKLDIQTQLPHIDRKQVLGLSKEQIQAITNRELFALLRKSQMQCISDEQLPLVSTKQVPGLDNRQLLALKGIAGDQWARYRDRLSEAQIDGFDTQELFDLLSERQIRLFAKKQHVVFMKKAEQIRACPDAVVPQLDADSQVPHILKTQVKHLLGERQIRALENHTFIKKLKKHQFVHLDSGQFGHLSQAQIKQFDKTAAVIYNLSREQIAYLPEEALCKLANEADLLQRVENKRLHHLSIAQIKTRNLSSSWTVAGHVAAGTLKTALMPLIIVTTLIINITKSIFCVFQWLFARGAERGEQGCKLQRQLKKTFLAGPAGHISAVVEIFNPAKYLQIQSWLMASCET